MPVTLKIGSLRYKKANGEYGGFDALGPNVEALPADGAAAGHDTRAGT